MGSTREGGFGWGLLGKGVGWGSTRMGYRGGNPEIDALVGMEVSDLAPWPTVVFTLEGEVANDGYGLAVAIEMLESVRRHLLLFFGVRLHLVGTHSCPCYSSTFSTWPHPICGFLYYTSVRVLLLLNRKTRDLRLPI